MFAAATLFQVHLGPLGLCMARMVCFPRLLWPGFRVLDAPAGASCGALPAAMYRAMSESIMARV